MPAVRIAQGKKPSDKRLETIFQPLSVNQSPKFNMEMRNQVIRKVGFADFSSQKGEIFWYFS